MNIKGQKEKFKKKEKYIYVEEEKVRDRIGTKRRKRMNIKGHSDSGPGSSVGIATDYGMDGAGSNPGGDEIFPPVQTGPGGPPSLLYNGYRVFPGGKVRPGRAADHSPTF